MHARPASVGLAAMANCEALDSDDAGYAMPRGDDAGT